MADDNPWKMIAMGAISALGTVSGALAWVVKEWRKDSRENAAQTLSRADAERDRADKRDEKEREASIKMADAIGGMADAITDAQTDTRVVLSRVVGAQNRLTDAVGNMRDERKGRPRSSESDAAFEAISDDTTAPGIGPNPALPQSRVSGRRR